MSTERTGGLGEDEFIRESQRILRERAVTTSASDMGRVYDWLAARTAAPADDGLRAGIEALVAEDVWNPQLRTAGELVESTWVVRAADLRALLAAHDGSDGTGAAASE